MHVSYNNLSDVDTLELVIDFIKRSQTIPTVLIDKVKEMGFGHILNYSEENDEDIRT